MPEFVRGFAEFAKTHPDIGEPLTSEYEEWHYRSPEGPMVAVVRQDTTKGTLRWYQESNRIAYFLTGIRDVSGTATDLPPVEWAMEPQGISVGQFSHTPFGVILHSSRSTNAQNTEEQEFLGTVNWVATRVGGTGLGWNVTVGPNKWVQHISPNSWGWNAREHSDDYLALEFAQPIVGATIGDEQIRAAADWIVTSAMIEWPDLPWVFPEHRELAAGIRDGKTDIGADQDVPSRLRRMLQTWPTPPRP